MVQHFHKPENALKRARELMEVGKQASALKALHDVIASKRHRSWTKTSEEIQLQFLELCVEMRRGKTAKDGLHQYKNMCQQVNIQSLETVIRYFIKLSEAKAEDARSKASEQLSVLADVDDLEEADTPEDLILSTMTTENTQDRTDREVLTPWLKFLWETYRTVLEILRNNPKLESLYQETAQHAFQFCLKYQRKTEFRRLCDLLRQHLQNVQKYANQANTINLNNPESLQLHLETRFAQLKAAAQLELWQEAFRSIEDIHGLIGMSKKAPKPQMMAAYFEKLASVFWKSGNYLFHAYAWQRLFYLSKEQKRNLSQEEASMLATNVLLATLVIPVTAVKSASEAYLEIDSTQEKHQRLALLVGLTQPPTRASLIRDLKAKNVLKYVAPELQMLYQWVEDEFHPLQLCDKVTPLLEYIKKDENLDKYTQPLHQTVLVRLLQQLSKVYQTMQTSVLCDLAKFATRHEIEKFLVDAVKNNTLQARLNHRQGTISFGHDMFFSSEGSQDGANPNFAAMQTENMRDMLTQISRGLSTAMAMIAPQRRVDKHQRKAIAFQKHLQMVNEEHKRILDRKHIIEERKIKAEKDKERALKEAERMRPKPAKVEPKVAVAAMEQQKKEETLEQISQIQKQNEDEILRKVVEIEEEKRKLQGKLKQVERKNDHLQRALRLEEIPKLIADRDARKAADLVYFEEQYKLEVERARSEHKKNLELKKNMEKMSDDLHKFIASVRARHEDDYKQEIAAFEDFVAQELERRKEERARLKEQRRREREEEERRRAEEEERRRQEEEQQRLEEEARMEAERQARLEAERREAEREAERKAREEERARLDEIAQRQREREREAEERARARMGGMASGRSVEERERPRDRDRAPPAQGGWRRDEPPRDDRDRRGGDRDVRPRDDRERGDWRRDEPREEPRDSGWRRDREEPPARRDRDFDRAGPREDRFRDERGPRDDRFRDERGPRDDRFRDERRDDRGPRDDRFRDERPRDDRDAWRKSEPAPRDDDRGGWSRGRAEPPRDREPRRDDGGWARREPAPAAPARDSEWRRGTSPPRRDASPVRRPMSPDRRDRDRAADWRGAPAPAREPERPRTPDERPESPAEGGEQDDGFTTVTKGRKGRR